MRDKIENLEKKIQKLEEERKMTRGGSATGKRSGSNMEKSTQSERGPKIDKSV
jgi:hypothetical protein